MGRGGGGHKFVIPPTPNPNFIYVLTGLLQWEPAALKELWEWVDCARGLPASF